VGADLAVGSVVEGSGTNDATEVIHPDIMIGPFLPVRPIRLCRMRELRPRPQKRSRTISCNQT
jgi:hypothetical protein